MRVCGVDGGGEELGGGVMDAVIMLALIVIIWEVARGVIVIFFEYFVSKNKSRPPHLIIGYDGRPCTIDELRQSCQDTFKRLEARLHLISIDPCTGSRKGETWWQPPSVLR